MKFKIILFTLYIILSIFAIDIVTHIELYSTTEKASLIRAIKAGDKLAIEHYEKAYKQQNRCIAEVEEYYNEYQK